MSVTQTQTQTEAQNTIQQYYQANAAEYNRIESRLNGLRGYFLAADRQTQYDILKKSYVYSALTAGTRLEFADEAYGKWLSSGDIMSACKSTAGMTDEHGKGKWIQSTLVKFESLADPVIDAINEKNYWKAAEMAADNLKGLGRIKGHFAIALITGKTACIDTHTASWLNENTELTVDDYEDITVDDYRNGVETLRQQYNGLVFLAQWIAFDQQRETVESHDLFYQSLDW